MTMDKGATQRRIEEQVKQPSAKTARALDEARAVAEYVAGEREQLLARIAEIEQDYLDLHVMYTDAVNKPSAGVDERAVFEAFVRTDAWMFAPDLSRNPATDDYWDIEEQTGWISWQARAQLACPAVVPDGRREWADVAERQPEHNEWVIVRWNGQFKVGQFDSKHPFSPAIVDRMDGKYWNFSEWSSVEAAAPPPAPAGDVVQVPRELLLDLRDLASDAAEDHRQAYAGYKLERQASMDGTVKAADALLNGGRV